MVKMESYWPRYTLTFQRDCLRLAKDLNTLNLSFSFSQFYPFYVNEGQIICSCKKTNVWKLPGPSSLKRADMVLEPEIVYWME